MSPSNHISRLHCGRRPSLLPRTLSNLGVLLYSEKRVRVELKQCLKWKIGWLMHCYCVIVNDTYHNYVPHNMIASHWWERRDWTAGSCGASGEGYSMKTAAFNQIKSFCFRAVQEVWQISIPRSGQCWQNDASAYAQRWPTGSACADLTPQ